MNKKIITYISLAVIAAFSLLLGVGRLIPVDGPPNYVIEVVATLLALPVRLYAYFVYHDHGSWPLPMLILLLALSGLMWGIIVERIVWVFSRRKTVQ